MKKTRPSLRIEKLFFMGGDRPPAELEFPRPLSFIYGASNTGKSFAVKTLDFMLGGSRELPNIVERKSYQRIQLSIRIDDDLIVLERGIAGGDFQYKPDGETVRILAARHNAENNENLSNYLLSRLNMSGKEVAKDKSGTKKALSFRDIAKFCVTDETSIQAERSPVESGDIILAGLERNVFKFLLTGEDDSALITQEKPKDFQTGRSAQLRIIDDMISQIDVEIAQDFPDAEKLHEINQGIADELKKVEADITAGRGSIRTALDQKRRLSTAISKDQQRISHLSIALENFSQLQNVYTSDIARLEAIEEAGFLFSIDKKKPCPVCGAPPAAQVHSHGLSEIEKARAAAEVEIAKIKRNQIELLQTIVDADNELVRIGERLLENKRALEALERELQDSAPSADEQQQRFAEIIPRRDRVKRGLELLSRRAELERRRIQIGKAKQARRKSNFQHGLSTETAQEFADEVSGVLSAWGFPGDHHVTFDLQDYDLIIDGKRRRDNGKGVRAITHAAFKVALLTFCRGRGLPHPGFVVLDTPLITYRDPIRSRLGALAADELLIKRSDLKDRFFEHLGSLAASGQIILFDNADPPAGAAAFAHIETFTNDPAQGRQGLFPPLTAT